MSLLDPTPLATYFNLLSEAEATAAAVDKYDLKSKDPRSKAVWALLQRRQAAAQLALVDHVERYNAILREAFQAP